MKFFKKTKKRGKNKRSFIFRWLHNRSKWQRRIIYIVFIVVILLGLNYVIDASLPEVKNPTYGVSFSIKAAEDLGVDWKANFSALLDDMKIRNFRLMSYWDLVEPEQGKFDFKDLDWQMNEAAKRGANVSLAIGMRQPRWPECHKPNWSLNMSEKQRDDAIVAFNDTVIAHYKTFPALKSYQLENEAVNGWFGTCRPTDISKDRLVREFNAAKKADPDHPIFMSLSDQHGLPVGKPVPDAYGFSVYRVVWNNKTGPLKFYITYPTPDWYHRLRAWWVKTFKHRSVFIHELQVEPWGPSDTKNLSVAEQNRSMSVKQIHTNLTFARKTGIPVIYTWGGEWWYWRKTKFNDPSIWNAVKAELDQR